MQKNNRDKLPISLELKDHGHSNLYFTLSDIARKKMLGNELNKIFYFIAEEE